MVTCRLAQASSLDESGAETLELALVFPLAVFLVFAVIQLALMAYGVLALTAASERAAWDLPLSAFSAGTTPDAEEAVKQAILESSLGLDADTLEVTDATYEASTKVRSTAVASNKVVTASDSKAKYRISEFSEEQVGGDVSYTVSYTLPSLFAGVPGLSDMKISKTVTRERVQTSRTEIR